MLSLTGVHHHFCIILVESTMTLGPASADKRLLGVLLRRVNTDDLLVRAIDIFILHGIHLVGWLTVLFQRGEVRNTIIALRDLWIPIYHFATCGCSTIIQNTVVCKHARGAIRVRDHLVADLVWISHQFTAILPEAHSATSASAVVWKIRCGVGIPELSHILILRVDLIWTASPLLLPLIFIRLRVVRSSISVLWRFHDFSALNFHLWLLLLYPRSQIMWLTVKQMLVLSSSCTCPGVRTVLFHSIPSSAPDRPWRLFPLRWRNFIVQEASFTIADTVISRGEITRCIVRKSGGLVILELSVNDGTSSGISTITDDAGIDMLKSSTHIPIYYY